MIIKKTAILALVWFLAACGSAATPVPTTTPTTTTVPTATATGRPTRTPTITRTPTLTPQETITVMTYNVLVGAGVGVTDPDSGITGEERLPKVLAVIQAVNPDILGIEEATGWGDNGEARAHQVADALGMNYALGSSQVGYPVALFTKFKIQKVYPCCFLPATANSGLHAEVVTGGGRVLQVYVVHLKNEPQDVTGLIQNMAPYIGQDTILMGDMNFLPFSAYAKQLSSAGWVFPMVMDSNILDQIWTSPSLAPGVWPQIALPSELTYGASDHNPFVAKIGLYPPATK